MPSVIGAFKVVANGNGGLIQTGDLLIAAPSVAMKTYTGAGSFHTGDVPITTVAINFTLTNDPDVADDNVQKAATGT
ncbi:MAG TPA: spore germination protein [Bacilli bacterium]